MVRVFPKSANQPNEMALTICTSISRNCFRLMRDWKLESLANPPFRSERKKRSTSEGTPQFPNRISGKLPYHCLISYREGLGMSLKIMGLATIDPHDQKEHIEIHKIPKFGVNQASFD